MITDSAVPLDHRGFDAATPQLRHDALIHHIDNEAVVWSPIGPVPLYLDPVSAVVVQLLDGDVTMAELSHDVHEVLGIPQAVVRSQLLRTVSMLDTAGVLTTSQPVIQAEPDSDLFVAPPNP